MKLGTDFADTPLSRCEFYRQTCGLPAVIDPTHSHQIVVTTTHVWALVMPCQLGARVKTALQQHNFRTGPIMNHPRSGRWTYLVAPGNVSDDPELLRLLYRANTALVRDGSTIALPSPTPNRCFREWIDPPVSSFRPPAYQVVEAVRRCLITGQPSVA